MTGPSSTGAARRAVDLLQSCRRPLILCGRIDLYAAMMLVRVARRAGAVLAHAAAPELGPVQSRGVLATTLGEARVRTDRFLVVGAVTEERARAALDHLRAGTQAPCAHINQTGHDDLLSVAAKIGCVRAIVKGRPVTPDAIPQPLRDLAGQLSGARYGVAVVSPTEIATTALDALIGLVDDLSATTRWSLLSLPAPAGHAELVRATQMATGLPPPLAFPATSGMPRHEPFADDPRRLVTEGSVDGVLWIDADGRPAPAWVGDVQRVEVLQEPADGGNAARVLEEDHRTGTFVAAEGPSVLVTLRNLGTALAARAAA